MPITEGDKTPFFQRLLGKRNKTKAVNKTNNIVDLNNLATTLNSTYISKGIPVWQNFSELIYLLDCYYSNPIVQAIINIKAEAFANMKFEVIDLKTGERIPLDISILKSNS